MRPMGPAPTVKDMGARRSDTHRFLGDLVRLIRLTDPEEPVRRPRHPVVASRVTIIAGSAFLILALALTLGAVLASTGASSHAAPTAAAGVLVPMWPPSTGVVVNSATKSTTMSTTGPAAGLGGLSTVSGSVVIHVTGAVSRPGVVTLPLGSRVTDTINAVGGTSVEADTQQLSLTRVPINGRQIRVLHISEILPDPAPQTGKDAASGARAAPGKPGGDGAFRMVNIGTASASELKKLPGISPTLAQRIVEHRDSHGPFAGVDALIDVPGIGKAKFEDLREQATV